MTPRFQASTAKDFERSNATTKAFLGGKEKAWMSGQPYQTITTSSTTNNSMSITHNQGPGPSSSPKSMVRQDKGPNNNNSLPAPLEPGLDRDQSPTQRRRCGGTKNYPNLSSTTVTASPTSPAPSSPALGSVSWISSEPAVNPGSDAQNLLPSPNPNVETRRQTANVPDLEADTNPSPSSGGPHTTHLANLLAEYGGFEELEKHLEDAEKSAPRPSPIVVTRPHNTSPAPAVAGDSPEQRRPPSLPNQSQLVQTELQRPSTTTPNKRAQDNATEPRKRLQSFTGSRKELSQSPSAPTATHVGSLQPRPPPNSRADMQNFSQSVMLQLQYVLSQSNYTGLDVVRPRLELLHDACQRSEYSYLLLHQIYCLAHRHQGSNDKLGLSDLQKRGLNVVSSLLVSNEKLPPEILQWFCVFPLPLEVSLTQSPFFRKFHEGVMKCLEKLANGWENMKGQCMIRRCPPLVDEFDMLFGMTAFTLQKVVFTAILRMIWIGPYDACYRAADNAFLKNRMEVTSRTNFPIQDLPAYNQRVMKEYQQIMETHWYHTKNDTTAPLQFDQASLLAVQNSESRGVQPLPSARLPGSACSSALQVDIQATRRDAHTRNSNRNIGRVASTSGPQTAPLVGMWSSSMVPCQPSNANGSASPQSDPSGQGFHSPGTFIHHPGQDPRRTQSISGTVGPSRSSSLDNAGNSAQVGAPNRQASHTNAPGRFGLGFDHLQQRLPSTQQQQQYDVQTMSPRRQIHALNAQPPVPRAENPSVTHSNQFIRFDPTFQPYPPNPDISALHQAHVKSPVLVSSEIRGSPNIVTRYFRFINQIIMPTEIISVKNRHVNWEFTMQSNLIENLAKDRLGSCGAPTTRNIDSNSRLCRIRCIKLSSPDRLPNHNEWAVSENIWPGGTAVILNGNALEIRKKLHHGKDLPIDITTVVKEGRNSLSSAVIGFQKDGNASFAIGVEIIQIASEEQIKNSMRTIPSQEARQRILDRSFQVDPDIEVVFSQLIVDLTDPFTANLFVVPVRGSSCLHNQCFDLEVFLHSRNLEKPNEPCGPDSFRCPICGTDARPQGLFIDGFLVSVREQLERVGRLDAKAIILHQSGDWEIKEEEEAKGEQGDGTGRRAGKASVGRQSVPHEVIEIVDD